VGLWTVLTTEQSGSGGVKKEKDLRGGLLSREQVRGLP